MMIDDSMECCGGLRQRYDAAVTRIEELEHENGELRRLLGAETMAKIDIVKREATKEVECIARAYHEFDAEVCARMREMLGYWGDEDRDEDESAALLFLKLESVVRRLRKENENVLQGDR